MSDSEQPNAHNLVAALRFHKHPLTQQAADRIAELEREVVDLRKYLATSKADCPYCGLPAADMARCEHGFPGCGRADDM